MSIHVDLKVCFSLMSRAVIWVPAHWILQFQLILASCVEGPLSLKGIGIIYTPLRSAM